MFAQRKPNGELRPLVGLRKKTHSMQTLTLITSIRSVHERMRHSIWLGKNCSASLVVPKRIAASKWPKGKNMNSLHLTLQVEHSHTEDWLKNLVVPYRHFRASYVNISVQSLKPIDVQCAQYVNDIGIAAITAQQLIKNLRTVFQCLRRAGLKLSMAICHFAVQEVDLLGRTKTTKRVAPQKQNIVSFLEKVKFPRSKRALQRYIGFSKDYGNIILDWQNDSLHFFNYSKQRMPMPKFRSPLI